MGKLAEFATELGKRGRGTGTRGHGDAKTWRKGEGEKGESVHCFGVLYLWVGTLGLVFGFNIGGWYLVNRFLAFFQI